jgi:hypothetical protein
MVREIIGGPDNWIFGFGFRVRIGSDAGKHADQDDDPQSNHWEERWHV